MNADREDYSCPWDLVLSELNEPGFGYDGVVITCQRAYGHAGSHHHTGRNRDNMVYTVAWERAPKESKGE